MKLRPEGIKREESAPPNESITRHTGRKIVGITIALAVIAREFSRRAVALDPVNAQARAFLASSLSVLGQREEARAEYAREIELNPSAPNSHGGVGLTYLLEGKFEEAATAAQQDMADWARLLIVSCARWAQKRIPESDAALAELIAKTGETAAYQVAEV